MPTSDPVSLPTPPRQWCRAGWRWEVAVLAGLAAFIAGFALLKPFRPDEIEHVHAAWRVAVGQVPYRDFFEHHHPLLWYVLAALLPLVGQSGATILIFRAAFWLLACALIGVTWFLARDVTRSRRVAWLSVLLLTSTTSFLETSTLVRPDVPMVLCAVWSVFLFVRGSDSRRRRDAIVAGVAAGVAFAFLQKAALLFVAFAALAAVRRMRMRPLPGSAVAWFGVGLGTTLALAGGALAAAGAWPDYVWTNWTFNALLTADIVRLPTTGSVVVLNLPFWILASGGAAVLLWRTRVDAGLASVAVVGSAMLGCLVVTRALRLHYLMLPLPMLAVVAAWALHELFERLALSPRQRCAVVMLIALPPVVGRAVSMKSTNQPQQAAIDFVLARSAPDEAMYDPALAFNVFRPDLHYFGDLPTDLRRVGEWYRRAAGARFAGYDPCARVHAGRPRFVSDAAGRFEACGLGLHYRPTAFEGLYQRVD